MRIVKGRGPWHTPKHGLKYCNLDTAIKVLPLAYAYDMLYHAMTDDERRQCREALRAKAFADFMKAHHHHDRKRRRFTDEKGRAVPVLFHLPHYRASPRIPRFAGELAASGVRDLSRSMIAT